MDQLNLFSAGASAVRDAGLSDLKSGPKKIKEYRITTQAESAALIADAIRDGRYSDKWQVVCEQCGEWCECFYHVSVHTGIKMCAKCGGYKPPTSTTESLIDSATVQQQASNYNPLDDLPSAVFVDSLMACVVSDKWKWPQACHMFVDTNSDLTELHLFASRIGLQKQWFQDHTRLPHYDLNPTRRLAAIEAGAIEADRRKTVDVMRRWVEKKQNRKG